MKIIGILALTAAGLFAQAPAQPKAPARPGLTLTSSSFEDGGIIPNKFTQNDPKPVSPKLDWTNAPAGVVSYVLWMHDPDTSLQKKTDEVLHWLAFNIPGTAAGLPEGVPNEAKLADGTIQPKSLRGAYGYMGPGAGAAGPYHHYTWELFALDTKLDLTADASLADVLKAIDGHVLAKAAVEGRFHR